MGESCPLQQEKDDKELEEWRQEVRAKVTALKCHVMASRGLTPEASKVVDVEEELGKVKGELKHKAEEVERLSRIRDEVENELQELTANLFQEAHSMVHNANQRAASAERSLREAMMQVEVLQAEVTALKALVITSTPAAPNPHLHPQLISKSITETGVDMGEFIVNFRAPGVDMGEFIVNFRAPGVDMAGRPFLKARSGEPWRAIPSRSPAGGGPPRDSFFGEGHEGQGRHVKAQTSDS
ncbi:putative guanine nucleotide exchange factor for Rab-3A-like [Penaeus vannamei]|uniref:Putative guanine nucleotide exchange factor for Rab-3A-like n=1 Tax=Penaeus vannamei TaxID=6689 RepID=A0A3R7MIP3_PENVA|nr:putative guanine nucleotide exchange factor for Rab-3A-like [Penaeus vannamei]